MIPTTLSRPVPPDDLLEITSEPMFAAAHRLSEWARETFIADDALLYNEDHRHLQHAIIGTLWTNVSNARQGRAIVGQCELGAPRAMMGKWAKARAERQLLDWFGMIPDFLITIDANYATQCSDAEFCALVEHELYHAGQERDAFGAPRFRRDGSPVYGIRGHDVEEFVGVVRRYGADASHVRALVDAANADPQIASVRISQACGTCQLRVA